MNERYDIIFLALVINSEHYDVYIVHNTYYIWVTGFG